ncbi:Uncharacterised protein [Serratia grimesii]|jgi:hypothetical protein|uniref:hypothetical protein n=1 Tax=Serratia grimesii TaxID=82995 RepID=UPI001F4BDBD6|nr:hypothetical protein [Serratia grimesii]ULG12691.1 hypothetical protein 348p1_00054 [Serratia grimesii]CAI2793747.1 Uncharacterised protein [Serratia grimesii]
MSGFKELTKANKFDYLVTTDQFSGAAGITDSNHVFVIFRVRDEKDEPLLIEPSSILQAFTFGYIKIITYIGFNEYSVSLTETNPNGCHFILKEAKYQSSSFYHVIHLIRGSLIDHCAISVSIKMDEDSYETTSLITNSIERRTPPSFAII